MSSSSNPALEPEAKPEIRPFPYAELAAPPGANAGVVMEAGHQIAGENQSAPGKDGVGAQDQTAAALAERQHWEAQLRAGFDQRLQEVRESVRAALADFVRQRGLYFQQVEAEVVQLALSIARKILRREAEIDSVLLAGMVRVALERVESGTKVTVRVHPQQVSECRAYFAQRMEAHEVPEVVEDPNLAMDHCILQTELGTTELGPEVQLKEIEQGLLDLLERRPKGGA
jgi:flagellar biosynthesis/type III secretory pathway protein FliH